jgi:LCP family protein required for cell wall assembly
VDTDIVNDDFTDGLDLPQLIEGQYTVLFLGFDEDQELTDVIWICQFDIAAAKLHILQIPRDSAVPNYTSNPTTKINSVYYYAWDQDSSKIQRVVNCVQENFGIPIDAYITTTCFDIVDIVDLVGGIPMNIDNEIVYEADKIIPAGENVILTGEQAEWFVRFRHDWLQGDIGRVQNQRRFMAAAMQKILSIVKDEGRLKLYSYLNTIYKKKWIATNMSVDDLSKLADFGSTLTTENVSVNMVPGEDAAYIGSDGQEYSIYSIHKRATVDMLNEYFRPYQRPMLLSESNIMEFVSEYEYQYELYDDTGITFKDLEKATEPPRASDYN